MTQVEYVGVQIDENGLSFSKEKKESVMNFPKPEIQKQLKSFLGLANYFRTHVRNHSDVVRPLEGMLRDYHKNRKLEWSDMAIEAFEAIKLAIHECQTLSFLDETGDIHFKSDASYYGIGVYLSQIVNAKEMPISFLSKTLSKEQLNWKVPEKECYAIWYGLKKLEYLIRDVRFTLHTDHRNLTFLKTAGSDKVMRWKLEIQEYDCKVIFIKGEDNHIADNFSRLCAVETLDEDEQLCSVAEFNVYIPDKLWHIIEKSHNARHGHGGVLRTMDLLRAHGHNWPEMREHVREFIRKCPFCQKTSQIKVPIHANPFTLAAYEPMKRLCIDTIGPLPPDEYDNRHIIVIIDSCT
jgi:hypothetical protein